MKFGLISVFFLSSIIGSSIGQNDTELKLESGGVLRYSDLDLDSGIFSQPDNQYPYMVSIWYPMGSISEPKFMCSGVMIGASAVLTIASCFDGYSHTQIKRMLIFPNIDGDSVPDPGATCFEICAWYKHPNYRPNSYTAQTDDLVIVTLIESIEAVQLGRRLVTIRLPSMRYPPGSRLKAAGFEAFSLRALHPILRESEIVRLGDSYCSLKVSRNRFVGNPKAILCANQGTNDMTCPGDAGGPVVAKGRFTQSDVLVGLISFSLLCGTTTFRSNPPVIIDINYHRNWIMRQLLDATLKKCVGPGTRCYLERHSYRKSGT